MLVFSGMVAFAAEASEDGTTVSSLLITQDKAAAMSKTDMKDLCNDQTIVIMDKKSMDKMMVMMTVDQFNLMMDNLRMDTVFQDQLLTMGTEDQWLMLSKDQKNIAIDQLMLTMTQDQMDKMTDIMMRILTKEQLISMITDNTNIMLTNGNALEPLQEDMVKMSKGQSMMLRDKVSMDKMMKMMTTDQIFTLRDSMINDSQFQDQMMAMGTQEQWQTITKDQLMMAIDQMMMMTMNKDQMNRLTEKMMAIMTKEQLAAIMLDNTNTIQKPTVIVGYEQKSLD
jgi:hypothetical protein